MAKAKKFEPRKSQPTTAQEIVDKCNSLARLFYKSRGYNVEIGYRFDEASHPEERGMWNQAAIACLLLLGVDPDDSLTEIEE